jgi:diguanylate cyclase (GGDEF)-like protein/PAS domain S-box-containing protein
MPAFQDPEIYRDILDGLQIGVSVLDLQGRIVFWSDGAEQITGFARIEVLGHCCTENILPHCTQTTCEMCAEACPLAIAMHEGKAVEIMSFIHHKSGYQRQVHTWAIPLRNKRGSIIGVIQTFEGEFGLPEANDHRVQEQAWLDEVTGLPNQAMMQSHLRETLGTFTELHIPFGIVCLEVHELHQFQARYGHGATRAILQVLARTLRNTVSPTDFVGAWGEGRFLVVLMGCSEYALHAVGEHIVKMMANVTIKWWGEELSVAISIGRSGAVTGDTMESILQRARASTDRVLLPVRAAAAAGNTSED